MKPRGCCEMLEYLLVTVSKFVLDTIEAWGYGGVFFLMMLEGSFLPVPSEIILPFSGYLVHLGSFTLIAVAFWAAVGNIVGTIFTYLISRYLGSAFLYKYGRYFLVTHKDIDSATKLFDRHGAKIIFISRLIPGIRGFVPIPAGIAKMKFVPFVAYVFTGSFIYSLFLTYIGFVAGENWDIIGPYFRQFDFAILGILILAFGWWAWHHLSRKQEDGRIGK